MAGVAMLQRAIAYTRGSLPLVTPGAMANPTPCSHWDLRALLRHMDDSLRTLHEAIVFGHVELDPPPFRDLGADHDDPATDPVASLHDRACRMMRAWTRPDAPAEISIAGRELTPSLVAATGAVEIAVHGWDVAQACRRHRPIPPALAHDLLELCALVVGDADRPTRFAARVEVPGWASPSDRLVAFLGRPPGAPWSGR